MTAKQVQSISDHNVCSATNLDGQKSLGQTITAALSYVGEPAARKLLKECSHNSRKNSTN